MTRQSIEARDAATDAVSANNSGPFAVPLAGLAIAASALDLFLARGALRLVGNFAHRDFALGLEIVCRFVRNLAAVLVCVGLAVVTQRAMRSGAIDFGIGRRILLGTLAGILFPVLGIALTLPDAHTTVILLLVGIASGYLMAFTFSVSAFDRDASIDQRVACTFAMLFSLASLGAFVAQMWSRIPSVDPASVPTRSLRNLTELCYFALPVSLGIGQLARIRARAARSAAWPALAVAAIVLTAVVALERAFPADFDLLLYGALRLEALDGASVYAYASLLALSASGIALALLDSSRRRLGIGAALILLAGAGAGSPFALAHVVLGAAALGLVARDESASADQSTSGNAHQVS